MPKAHKPRSGSLQFWPRSRSKRIYSNIKRWLSTSEEKLPAFAGYKAGMTHIHILNPNPQTNKKNPIVSIPVTIIECPPLKPLSLRFYQKTPYGSRVLTQIFSKNLNKELAKKITMPKKESKKEALKEFDHLRLVVYTQPKLTGIGKKKPEIFEIPLNTKDLEKAKSLLEMDIKLDEVFRPGQFIDIHTITKGKGFKGAVKRFGISLKSHKSEKKRRSVGNLGSFVPRKTSWRVPQPGQMGYHKRTEYNKLVMAIDSDLKKINQKGGIKHYGNIKNPFILIKGSTPGASKRLIIITNSIRNKKSVTQPAIQFISTGSKQ